MSKSIIEIFDDALNQFDDLDIVEWVISFNDSDHMAGNIKDKGSFRSNFNVTQQENLLYCRDTSFWNERNQGTVMTDWGIRIIPDNDNPNDYVAFAWEIIADVTYKDDVFYFWTSLDHTEHYPIHKSWFLKNIDDIFEETLHKMASLFKEMAQSVVPQQHPVQRLLEEIEKTKIENPNKAFEMLKNILGKYPDWDGFIKWNLGYLAYAHLGDSNRAWKMLIEALESNGINEVAKSFANFWCSGILYEKDNHNPTIKQFLFNVATGDKNVTNDNGEPLWEQSMRGIRDFEKEYFGEKLSERPYAERKLIFPVNNLFNLSTISKDQVMPVELDSLLANSNLNFPLSHPQANQLYVAHPYNPNIYLLYDNYEIEILQDKLRELSEIAQSLGATEIDVKVISSYGNRNENKGSMSQSGRIEHWSQTNLGASQDTSYSRDEELNFEHMFNRHQTFAPKSTISQPANTIWLQGEPSWQRLIKQRLEGGLTSHREVIETKSSRVISGSASNQLKGEIESIFADLNLNWNKNEESRYSEHNNLVLSVDIKFSNIQPNAQISPTIHSMLSDAELEYKEEYEACLADGKIASSERRLLDRLASKLGLSPKQVKRIEESVGNPLTDEEKEYLDEYRACLADDPELSPSTRRLLSKMAKSLGLSEEQVNKLENLK